MRTKTCPLSGGMCFALSRASDGLGNEYFPYPQLTRKTTTASVTKMVAPSSKNFRKSQIRETKKNSNLTCKILANTNALVSRNFKKLGKPARADLGSHSTARHKEGRHELLCYQCCSRISSGPHNVMTQTSDVAFKSNQPPLQKSVRVAKRDVCLMTNDSPTGRFPDKFNCDLLKPLILGEFSESITDKNESTDVRNLEYNYSLFDSGKKRKVSDCKDKRRNACPDHVHRENESYCDGFEKNPTDSARVTVARELCRLNEEDRLVNLVLNGESGNAKRIQDITHIGRKNEHLTNAIGQHTQLKENSRFAQHENVSHNAFQDIAAKEELVQALKNGKKELIMHIHKAQGKVTEIRLKLMELSKAINSKASVDDSNKRLVHAEKLDRMLDETIKELGILSDVIPSNAAKTAGDTAAGDSYVIKNVGKPTVQKFGFEDAENRAKVTAKEILAKDFRQSKKDTTADRSKCESPAHSSSTTSTDVSSLSALQSELCSFFAAMKIQTDRLIEEAENHHEALLNYGNRRLGASCSSDLSSIISGFA